MGWSFQPTDLIGLVAASVGVWRLAMRPGAQRTIPYLAATVACVLGTAVDLLLPGSVVSFVSALLLAASAQIRVLRRAPLTDRSVPPFYRFDFYDLAGNRLIEGWDALTPEQIPGDDTATAPIRLYDSAGRRYGYPWNPNEERPEVMELARHPSDAIAFEFARRAATEAMTKDDLRAAQRAIRATYDGLAPKSEEQRLRDPGGSAPQ